MRRSIVLLLMVGFLAGCGSTVNVEQERATLMRLDREWAASVKDMDKFMSYYASDASVYPPGMPMATGSTAIREVLTKMSVSSRILAAIWAQQGRGRRLR